MGFFSKIVSFFKRDVSNSSDTQESLKNMCTSLDNVSTSEKKLYSQGSQDFHLSDTPRVNPTDSKSGELDESTTRTELNDSLEDLIEPPTVPQNNLESVEESYLDRIRREEEERKKREWLEFLKTKRAKRKKELEEQLVLIDKHLSLVHDKILAIKEEKKSLIKKETPNLLLKPYSFSPQTAKQFFVGEYHRIITMRELLQRRIEEERRRIEMAERTALINLENARVAIRDRNLERARECLDILSKQTAFIENKNILSEIKEIVFAITDLSTQLEAEKRAREEQRRKQEALAAQQRAEALERQRQEGEAQKLRQEEEKRVRAKRFEAQLKEKEKAQQEEIARLNELSSTLKSDASEIFRFLKNKGVYYLYHFTEASNIPLIRSRKGLYSWSYLLSHGMKIPSPGGNDTSRGLDRDNGLEDYVRLSLCKSHPMAYLIHQESEGSAHLVLLKIKIDVTMFETTLFSNINATDKKAVLGNDKEFLEENIDFEAIGLDWCCGSDPRHKKCLAEVMVKTFIPLKYIVNLDNPDVMSFQ